MEEIFGIEKFNIISDKENYYFFRALESGDVEDIEKGLIKDGENYTRIRTDRERWEETHPEGARWNAESQITLEEIFNHIKMDYSLQTNCISLTSNANVVRTYGEMFNEKYVMIKVPKKEMGEKVFNAGQYMLGEISKQVGNRIENGNIPENVLDDLQKIDNVKTSEEIKKIIRQRYKAQQKVNKSKARPQRGIKYRAPHARISNYQSLSEEQSLEKNKIIAKLTILEHKKLMEPLIPYSANNTFLIQTLGNAFSSSEQIYYGNIEGDRITEVQKEMVDMFSLLQQAEEQDEQIVNELKNELIKFVNDGRNLDIPDGSILKNDMQARNDITIEEMYEITRGKMKYGQANSIVNNMFYLVKGQMRAKELAGILRQITGNNPRYEETIKYIEENGFEIEPKITTRQNGKGYKISEAVSICLSQDEMSILEQVRGLSTEQLREIVDNRGLTRDVIIASRLQGIEDVEVSRERYYAEAIFSLYDWSKIGIEEFTSQERENLIQKIQESDVVNIYKQLEGRGVSRQEIPTVLLNTITGKQDELYEDLSVERIERFLGYYDVPNTGIQLRPYQQTAKENADEILKNNRFTSLILPTGGGKSFVTLAQLMEHQSEEMLYLAPQNEILEQIKDYIIKYIHGQVSTLGKSKNELVAEVFPNLKLATYPSLLSKEKEGLIKEQYGFIVLDELHRTGAKEWGSKLDELIENQKEETKVLGITATPRRDVDGINMANEMAEKLGYTNRDAVRGKHVAMNMSLINAIRMGLVVNPKIVSCEYTLQTDGSLSSLKEKIDSIEDIETRNEKLEEYEKLRRSLSDAKGIEQILQENIKKGGKYLVFLPFIEGLEDEDGNVTGRKKGKDKILDYEKQIMEYFKNSDIKPSFHSMLGEYGDKENERRLNEFQSKDTDETEFMLVINKANEGLHLDKLDGIIWLRAMDENSRILYLQQIGRIISAEDPNNPTKEENRPIAIDIVNNTIKVNWDNEITEKDDIEMMNLITDWTKKHDEMLPNINSNDMEESGYAKVLKEIQTKYNQYLNNNLEGLDEERKVEIQEIIALGTNINLWQTELPDRILKSRQARDGEQKGNNNELPFQITGILKDFVELEKEFKEKEDKIQKFIEKLKKLKQLGIEVSGIRQRDTAQTLAQRNGISITKEQATKLGLDLNEKIGRKLDHLKQAYKGNGTSRPPTQGQVRELEKIGVSLNNEKKDAIEEYIEKLKKLKQLGIEVSDIRQRDTIQTLAQRSRIFITEEQATELEVDLNDKIGSKLNNLRNACKGIGTVKAPNPEQVQKLKNIGIRLNNEKKDTTQEYIENLKKLKQLGIKVFDIKKKDTIQTLAQRNGISITEEQATELELDLNDRIGRKLDHLKQAHKGNDTSRSLTLEQVRELEAIGVSLKVRKRRSKKEMAEATISAVKDVELADKAYEELHALVEKTKEMENIK